MDTPDELDPTIVRRRIAALLRLQDSPVEGEAQAAAEGAARLAQKYRIDLFAFQQEQESSSQAARPTASIVTIYESSFAVQWRRVLARVCCHVSDCKFYVDYASKDAATVARLGPRYKGTRWTRLKAVGKDFDTGVTRQLFDYLDETIMRMGNAALQQYKIDYQTREQEVGADNDAARNEYGDDDYSHFDRNTWTYKMYKFVPVSFADSWRTGCAERVAARLRARDRADQQAVGAAAGTAMVLSTVRQQSLALAEQTLASTGIVLVSAAKSAKTVNPAGYAAGLLAGERIGLDPQLACSA